MVKLKQASLYIVPTPIGNQPPHLHIPEGVRDIIHNIKHFYVEEIRTARRFLKSIAYPHPLDEVTFIVINEHNQHNFPEQLLQPMRDGYPSALLSEAGMPCIADPGHILVRLAHKLNISVIPLTGSGAIVKALMASGLNGQQFTFHGYLPVKEHLLREKLRHIYHQAIKGYTQIFIEAPYRSQRIVNVILQTAPENLLFCIAASIDSELQFIHTQSIASWKTHLPHLGKQPCVFLIGSE